MIATHAIIRYTRRTMAEENSSRPYIASDGRSLIGTSVSGLVVGMAGWLASLAIQQWIIDPVFCRSSQTATICANGDAVAWTIAMIVVSIFGLLSMVRWNVFRPLLVALAALIALWGVHGWLAPLEWWQAMLWHGGLFMFAYLLFAWVARINAFVIALILTILLIILARLVVIST